MPAHRLPSKSGFAPVHTLARPLSGEYVLTGDRGVFVLRGDQVHRLLPTKTYGIAIDGDALYLGAHVDRASLILRVDRRALAGKAMPIRTLARMPAAESSDRVHALALAKDGGLLVAHTGRNAIVEIDRQTGEARREILPFADRFGTPIAYNVNHINSVAQYGDVTLFVANRAGMQSLIGMIDGDRVTGFAAGPVGLHDILLDGDDVYCCETFGDIDRGKPFGAVLRNGRVLSDDFRSDTPWTVRGLAGDVRGELLAGHSVRGNRAVRHAGEAALLRLGAGGIRDVIPMPMTAQIYQIVGSDGRFLANPPPNPDAAQLRERLRGWFGAPVMDVRLAPLAASAAMKWRAEGATHPILAGTGAFDG